MYFKRVHYMPIAIAILFPFTFVLTYLIATSNENVTPLFPYISDTGTFSPESCIFGQMLNLGAMMLAVIGYVRYLQLCDLHTNNDLHCNVKKLNGPSLIMAMLTALGISIVGNFQEKNALIVHLVGALLAFGAGGMYISIQSYISFKIYPILGNKILNWIRVVLSAGTILFFFSTFVFAGLSFQTGTQANSITINTKWKPGEPGWGWHFMSALSEWIMACCLICFLGSFVHDFKKVTLTTPSVSHKLNDEKRNDMN